MGLGLTTQLQRQVGTQIAKLIIFTPSRVNLNKRNSIHPSTNEQNALARKGQQNTPSTNTKNHDYLPVAISRATFCSCNTTCPAVG